MLLQYTGNETRKHFYRIELPRESLPKITDKPNNAK